MKTIDYSVEVKSADDPVSSAAATVAGNAIDTLEFSDGRLVVQCGAASGTPTTQSVACTVTESDTSGGSYSAVSGAVVTLTADNAIGDIEIPDFHKRKRYLKVSTVVSFTGGSTPAIPFSAILELGKKIQEPVD